MDKNILVVGGSGFIGRHVSEYLSSINIPHTIFDRVMPTYKCNYVLGDINDIDNIKKQINLHYSIINLAGILGTTETINTPEFCYSSNISGALNIYEILKNNNKPCVQISVGNFWMNNPYSITKNTAEKLAQYYNNKHFTNIRIVRALNAYGPYQSHHPVRKLIPNLILPALQNQEILIYGNGNQKMDMIYVKDLAKILFFILTKQDLDKNIIYEAGSGLSPSVNDISKLVLNLTSSKSKIHHIDMRKGEDPNSIVIGNPNLIKGIGYDINSLIDLESGLLETINYFKKKINID